MGKHQENHRKMMVEWDFIGFTLWFLNMAMENGSL